VTRIKQANIYDIRQIGQIYKILEGLSLGKAQAELRKQNIYVEHLLYAYMPLHQTDDYEFGLLHESINMPAIRVPDDIGLASTVKKALSYYELQPGVKNVVGFFGGTLQEIPGIMQDLGYLVAIHDPRILLTNN